MDDGTALLGLFQLTDSFFPSGAFAHSQGLETFVQDGLVSGLQDLERFLAAYLKGQVARSDALIVKLTFEAAAETTLEDACGSMKSSTP